MGVKVIGTDISADRVEQSKTLGVAHALDGSRRKIRKLTRHKGVSCAMDCAGGEAVKTAAVRCTAPWGRIALNVVGGNLNVDGMKDVIGKQRTILGSYTFSEVGGLKNCAYSVADHSVDIDRSSTRAAGAYREFDTRHANRAARTRPSAIRSLAPSMPPPKNLRPALHFMPGSPLTNSFFLCGHQVL
jgi:(R,R)-butanediol dehydrogenase/meso-butanediol dehydrogenase/diacetyl reductase